MIKEIFFFPNGSIACTDDEGRQVTNWQTNLLCDHLRKMLRAGVITGDTKIAAAGREAQVKDWIGPDDALEELRSTTDHDTAS